MQRHELGGKTHYLGAPHLAVEQRQSERIAEVAASLMASNDETLLDIVDLVFDALTIMFSNGGQRYYAAHLPGAAA